MRSDIECFEEHGKPETADATNKSKLGNRLISMSSISSYVSVLIDPKDVNIMHTLEAPYRTQTPESFLKGKITKTVKVLPTMSTGYFIMKVRKSLNISKSVRLGFSLSFDEDESRVFAPLDFSDLERDVELAGVSDGSTILCYPKLHNHQ